MGADYSFEVKNIEIWLPAFFKRNNSSVATVLNKQPQPTSHSSEREVGQQEKRHRIVILTSLELFLH